MLVKVVLLLLLFTKVVLTELSNITLYKNETNAFAGVQGYVLYGNDSFINGSIWDYKCAMVVCREAGK